jgi:ABC-2 type transport system ATP-binding protein
MERRVVGRPLRKRAGAPPRAALHAVGTREGARAVVIGEGAEALGPRPQRGRGARGGTGRWSAARAIRRATDAGERWRGLSPFLHFLLSSAGLSFPSGGASCAGGVRGAWYTARVTMSDPIAVRGLTKRYGAVDALRGVDFTVRAGEVVGFLGRNGAGKSTTIRILMGITRPSGGEVRMFGEPLGRDLVGWRQRIGYVAQEQSFYGWMTPEGIGRFVSGFFPRWDAQEHARLIKLLDLPPRRRIGTFSGGMKVKLALSLALAHRPPLLVLDEPTAGLDPVARREFLEIVRDESEKSGRTTFFSSHLVDEIELVSQRVAILDEGKTRYEGDVRALVDRVRRLRVAATAEEEAAAGPEAGVASSEAGWSGEADAHRHDAPSGELAYGALAPMTVEAVIAEHALIVLHEETREGERRLVVEADDPARFDAIAELAPELAVERLPLEEIFIAMVRHRNAG